MTDNGRLTEDGKDPWMTSSGSRTSMMYASGLGCSVRGFTCSYVSFGAFQSDCSCSFIFFASARAASTLEES